MTVYSGRTNASALLYDSLRTESVPFEGLLSHANSIRIEFTSHQGPAATAFNIRFEGEPPWGPPLLPGGGLGPGEGAGAEDLGGRSLDPRPASPWVPGGRSVNHAADPVLTLPCVRALVRFLGRPATLGAPGITSALDEET